MQRIGREVARALPLGAAAFPARLPLPPRYGRGMPERVVEACDAPGLAERVEARVRPVWG